MKSRTKVLNGVSLVMAIALIVAACTGGSSGSENQAKTTEGAGQFVFDPAPFPPKSVTGIDFPTSRDLLDSWVATNNTNEIYKHAWGIWAGLTAESDVTINGQKLLVYETWLDVQQLGADGNQNLSYDEIIQQPRDRNYLSQLEQLQHGTDLSETIGIESGDGPFYESVKYDPTASEHAVNYYLFNLDSMKALYSKVGNDSLSIKDFPNTAIAIKPTYALIDLDSLEDGRFSRLAAWPGSESARAQTTSGFPSSEWDQYVWIDIKNQSSGNGSVAIGKNPPRTDAATYNLNDFINIEFTEEHAAFVNANDNNEVSEVDAGDIAVLVGMHVTTKELKRWTWQTYFWEADPSNPHDPSSADMADLRPLDLLSPAAAHYAMAPAYSMILPAQPRMGGVNVGDPIYTFNPYLEAPFDSATFLPVDTDRPDIKSEMVSGSGNRIYNYMGVRTNCMSCHAMASVYFDDKGKVGFTQYVGNRYIDLGSPEIVNGLLMIDFLWSINNTLTEEQQ